MVFAYIYQASRFTKTVVILGIFIIIGLATRDWNYEEPDTGQLNNKYEGSTFTTNPIGKKLVQDGRLDDTSLSSTDTTEDDVNDCAEICLANDICAGFNYHGNKCEFIAGVGLKMPQLVEAVEYRSFSKNEA